MNGHTHNGIGQFSVFNSRPNKLSLPLKSPGDILFSSVTGGPPHVHSPDQQKDLKFPLLKNVSENTAPSLLYSGLVDPNIDLPTISVCEVDAVFNSLALNISRKNVTNINLEKKSEKNDFLKICDEPSISCKNKGNCTLHDSNPIQQENYKQNNLLIGFRNDGHKSCVSFDTFVSVHSITRSDGFTNFNKNNTQKSTYFHSTNQYCKKNTTENLVNSNDHSKLKQKVSFQSMLDILPLFPSCKNVEELGVLAPEISDERDQICNSHSEVGTIYRNNKVRQSAYFSGSVSKFSTFNDSLRDRSPIGSLDLATHLHQGYNDTHNICEASKHRQANLSVRRANQAKILFQLSTKSKPVHKINLIDENQLFIQNCSNTNYINVSYIGYYRIKKHILNLFRVFILN